MPCDPVAAVTVLELSPVKTLPNPSSSMTTGCVPKFTPAVAVLDGCVVITRCLLAAFGVTAKLLEPGPVKPPVALSLRT